MKLLRAASVLVLSGLVLTACDDDATGVTVADLEGMWNATQFEYTDVSGRTIPGTTLAPSIDAISDAGGSLTLNVAESGSFTGSLRVPGLTVNPSTGETITVTVGGTFSIDGDILTVDFDSATEALGLFGDFTATYELNNDVLTFVNEDTTFDFALVEAALGLDPAGPVDAELEVTLQR